MPIKVRIKKVRNIVCKSGKDDNIFADIVYNLGGDSNVEIFFIDLDYDIDVMEIFRNFICGYGLPDFALKNIKLSSMQQSYKINKFLSVRLNVDSTEIYVKDKLFTQCKYLLLNIPDNQLAEDIDSIDEAEEYLSNDLEPDFDNQLIPYDTEFWGHCSNLQTWAENDYDTRILHRNLAFPLLKRLTEAGDLKAKKRFKEEIVRRFLSNYHPVMEYLFKEKYLIFLSEEEIGTLIQDSSLSSKGKDILTKVYDNFIPVKCIALIPIREALSNSIKKEPLFFLEGMEWNEVMTKSRAIQYARNIYNSNVEEDGNFPHDAFPHPPSNLKEAREMINWVDEELYRIESD